MSIAFTLDLEDSRTDMRRPVRFPAVTRRVLAALRAHDVRGTFFVVGEVAEAEPDLIREVHADGHEVALHGHRHVPLTRLDPARFAEDLARGRAVLEDVVGAPVTGYRAPIFSLVPRTAWAVEVLVAAGFTYSSSVLPAANPLNGWPGAPREPFRWEGGLVELPCPVAGRGRLSVPYLGGVYLRYLPRRVAVRLAKRAQPGAWIYCHPYDFDPDEPFDVLPEASWLVSRILHHRRGGTFDRIALVLEAGGGSAGPLQTLAAEISRRAPGPLVQAQ